MTGDSAEALIVRPKELYDGAVPSGNSMQILNLLRMARLTGNAELEAMAKDTSLVFADLLAKSPSHFSQALIGLNFAHNDSWEFVVVGERDDETTQSFLAEINADYRPNKVVLLKTSANAERLAKVAPFTKNQCQVDARPTVYLCRDFACEQPINSLAELKRRLSESADGL